MSLVVDSIKKAYSALFSSVLYQNQYIRLTFAAIGGALVIKHLLSNTGRLLEILLVSEKNLIERYGQGSWAVITGASEGIGKAFCLHFAKRGFNIVLIARNQQKLEEVIKEIKRDHPLVQTRVVLADFSESYQQGFIEKIEKETADLDVSVLVNNVGQIFIDHYIQMPIDQIRNQIIVNCLSQALVTRVFLPRMASRSRKSAIINMSSLGSQYPRPFFQLYSATKAFNDYFSRGLAEEHPNIDILSLKPGFVSSRMTSNKKIDVQTTTTDEFVTVGLRHLGNSTTTFGHWKHRLNAFYISLMPEWYRVRYYTKRFQRMKGGFK